MLDSNVVFRLDGLREKWLHDRPAAQALVARGVGSADAAAGLCLVTGEQAPIARLHPSIKGVRGAQSSGAAIVSFNQSSFASYGKEQGDNAPVSEFATFAYTTALNALLASNDHRVQIGDASVVFWAEPGEGEEEGAKAGESLFARMCSGEELAPDDKAVDEDLKSKLAGIAKGRASNDLRIRHDMPFYVLGLSPNAARISVRFWFETTLADLAKRLLQHFDDLWLEPAPWRKGKEPSVRSLVNQLAPMRIDRDGRLKIIFDQAPDHLIGELVRAVLSGSEYPYAILPMLLQRLKADRIVTGLRVALIKAVLARRERILRRGGDQVAEETKMVTDQFADDIGRKLGRLFALYEKAQDACFDELNSGLRDKYYASAMATPQYVFHAIDCNYQHHLSKMRKGRNLSDWIMKHKVHEYYKRYAGWLDREIGALNAEIGAFPMQLTNAQQGQFVIGYYQQKYERKTQQQDAESNQTASDEGTGELK